LETKNDYFSSDLSEWRHYHSHLPSKESATDKNMIASTLTYVNGFFDSWNPLGNPLGNPEPQTGAIDNDTLRIVTDRNDNQFTIDVPRISKLLISMKNRTFDLHDSDSDSDSDSRADSAHRLMRLLENLITCDTVRDQVCGLMCQTVLNQMYDTVLLKRFQDTPFVCTGDGKQVNRITILSNEHVCVKIQKVFRVLKIQDATLAGNFTLTCKFDLNTEGEYECLHSYCIDQTTDTLNETEPSSSAH
jgi:hypothetical protein